MFSQLSDGDLDPDALGSSPGCRVCGGLRPSTVSLRSLYSWYVREEEIPLPILPTGKREFSRYPPKPVGGRTLSRQAAVQNPRAPGLGPAYPFTFTFLPQSHLDRARPTGSPLSFIHSAGAVRGSGPLPRPGQRAWLHWGAKPPPVSPTQLRSDPSSKRHKLPAGLVCELNGVAS